MRRLAWYASSASSFRPWLESSAPNEKRASESLGSSSSALRSFSSAAAASLGSNVPPSGVVMSASAQFLRHVAHLGLIRSAHLKNMRALRSSIRPRAARPWFCSRRTCSTRSAMSKKAPRM